MDELQALHAVAVPPEGRSAAPEGPDVKSEVIGTFLYGCATWTSLEGHYNKFRTAHHRSLV